ncbi:MAG: septum formation initiator family protein [Lactobacillaceae bacterium]|jgi:cell division protein FtsB|nr:septum formation initiator family protein [Lactobacillaceae bacterium]
MAANPLQQQNSYQAFYSQSVSADFEQQVNLGVQNNMAKSQKIQSQHKLFIGIVNLLKYALIIIFAFSAGKILISYYKTNQQINDVNAQYKKYKKTNNELKLQNKNLKNPEYLEKVLRDRYQYSKYGEVIFNFPSESLKK